MSDDTSILTPSSDEQVAWILGYEDKAAEAAETTVPSKEIESALAGLKFDYKLYGFKSAVFTLQTTLEKYISKPLAGGILLFLLNALNKNEKNETTLNGLSALFVNRGLNMRRPNEQVEAHIPFMAPKLEHLAEKEVLLKVLFKEPEFLTGPTQDPISDADKKVLGNSLKVLSVHWEDIKTIKPDFSPVKLAFGQMDNAEPIMTHLRKFVEKIEPTGRLMEQRALLERKTGEVLKKCYQKDADTPVSMHQAKQAEMIAVWILDSINYNTTALGNLCNVMNFALTQNLLDQPKFHDLPQDMQKAKIELLKERQAGLRKAFKLQENERLTNGLLFNTIGGNFAPALKTFLRALLPNVQDAPLNAAADFICGTKAEGDISHPLIPGMIRESRILNARMNLHEKLGLLALPKPANSRT